MTNTGKPTKRVIGQFVLTHQSELVERLSWLIRVRWLAALGVASTIIIATALFDILVDRNTLLMLSGAIFLVNTFNHLYQKHLLSTRDKPSWHKRISLFANIQISVDLVILTALIYYSGGVENPFYFYFIFHMIIASILLSPTASYLQATWAVILFNCMLWLEGTGVIHHHRLFPFFGPAVYSNPLFLAAISGVFTTTIYFSVYMATSITRRLRVREEELIQLKNSLEQTNQELRALHEHRSRFILKVEHELKAPLGAVQSMIAVIMTSFRNDVSAKVRDLLARAERRINGLLEMIQELLELSRIQAKSDGFKQEMVDMDQVIRHQAETLRSLAEDKGLSLEVKIEGALPQILGDPKALEEVVMNLLSNAVKYTESGVVRVEARSPAGRELEITVSDTGIGVPEDETDKLFEEFFRGEKAKENYEGTGLGLSIVREIVEVHGGSIDVESSPGKGTKFTIRLPV